jgi:hypothetical protein
MTDDTVSNDRGATQAAPEERKNEMEKNSTSCARIKMYKW